MSGDIPFCSNCGIYLYPNPVTGLITHDCLNINTYNLNSINNLKNIFNPSLLCRQDLDEEIYNKLIKKSRDLDINIKDLIINILKEKVEL